MIEVKIKTDGDGHYFVIPTILNDEFEALLEKGEVSDDFSEFEKTFGKYATGGGYDHFRFFVELEELIKP